MILQRFLLNEIDDEFQLDADRKRKMIESIIPSGLDNIMSALSLNERTFETELSAQQIVKLPYDFTYANKVEVEGSEYDRVDMKDLEEGLEYAIELDYNTLRGYNQALTVKDILAANIETTRSREVDGYRFEIRDVADNVLAIINDSENILYQQAPFASAQQIKLVIVPDQDIVRVKDDDILQLKTYFSVLELRLLDGTTQYFVAEDGSLYQDQALTTLLTRSRPSFSLFRLHFPADTTGTLKLYYVRSLPKYINAYEDEPLIDLYKLALKAFCLKELYFSNRKTQSAAIWERKYQQELQFLLVKKGKMKEFKTPRRVAPNFRPFRLPFQR